MKVLIAEDDLTTRELLSSFVKQMDLETVLVGDGEAAVKCATGEKPPPIVILDWEMPKMSGIEVCRHIRSSKNLIESYVILLTGRSSPEDIVEGLEAGANDYMAKPIRLPEFMARLKIGIQTVELQQQIKSLKKLIPICAWCKKVRDDEDYWQNIEEYLMKNSNFVLSHGICSHCREEKRKKKTA